MSVPQTWFISGQGFYRHVYYQTLQWSHVHSLQLLANMNVQYAMWSLASYTHFSSDYPLTLWTPIKPVLVILRYKHQRMSITMDWLKHEKQNIYKITKNIPQLVLKNLSYTSLNVELLIFSAKTGIWPNAYIYMPPESGKRVNDNLIVLQRHRNNKVCYVSPH